MKELIDVFRMNEISVETRCKIIVQLGRAINNQHCMNITEPLVYELVKQLDPSFEGLKELEEYIKNWNS